jgi:hypothetical protein
MSITKIIFAAVIVVVLCLVWFLTSRMAPDTTNPPVASQNPIAVFPVARPAGGYESEAGRQNIRTAFYNFLSQPAAIGSWTTFTEGEQIIPLGAVLTALEARVEPSVERLLDQGMWQLYQCAGASEGQRQVVLSMRFALQPNYVGDLYAEQVRGFGLWEQSLFRDTATILFPEEYYRTTPIQATDFSTNAAYPYAQVRSATVRFADGSSGEVSYLFVGDELLVGSNTACVVEAQELLFDTGA